MSAAGNVGGLLSSHAVQQRVEAIWDRVFTDSNRVLTQAKVYGFSGLAAAPNPNVHQMVVTLQIFSAVIDVLITNGANLGLPYDETRMLLNAKSQITRMEQLAAALNAGDEDGYNEAIGALEHQAHF